MAIIAIIAITVLRALTYRMFEYVSKDASLYLGQRRAVVQTAGLLNACACVVICLNVLSTDHPL